MGKKIRFGIVGTSAITEWFLNGAAKVNDFELVAVYSRNIEKAREFGKKYGARLFFSDLDEMSKSKEIDAVYIASPNSLHAKQAIICMNNKKHVLSEKAFASNTLEARKMIDAANINNVLLMEAMKTTMLPNFNIIKNNLHKIGKIRRYFASYCQYSSRYDKYKSGIIENAFKPELSNGALMDIGVYCIYPMVALFGKPQSIKAQSYMLETGVDGEGSILFNYGDFDGVIQYSKIANSYLPSEIQGEEGSILIEKINTLKKVTIIYRDGSEEIISQEQEDDDMCYEIQEFISLIQNNVKESQVNSHYNSLKVIEIMEEARKQIGLVYLAD
ncbi:Gfo/Idh/MocA family protein [Clostridium paraputrificum]|uniref:Gfo/Idh/MocA family protein n=1 Tax=Clostridium paraputrificum TaxID=29363 RepID=UPI003D335D45